MGLHPELPRVVPPETRRVALAAFPHGHPYLQLRDAFPQLFTDAEFRDLFPASGQPALAPGRLALVTLLQFAEDLSDRQAAEAVRARLDWKYLLGLELTDPGFDASVLGEFRDRLLAHGAAARLFEHLLARFTAHGWVKARGKQRTDSTHVLAAVRHLNRLELLGETVRHVLQELAVVAPEWLRPHLDPAWAARYGHRVEASRLPSTRTEREALAHQLGTDGYQLLTLALAPTAPPGVRTCPAVTVLLEIWRQQFTREETAAGDQVRWRTPAELPPAAQELTTPFDPDARYSQKRGQEWVGYKWHVTETCEPDQPQLLVAVTTTPATQPDQLALPTIHATLARHDRLPRQHYVDAGYTSGTVLVTSQAEYGVEVCGPVEGEGGWQARTGSGYAGSDFQVDWAARTVTCPAGQPSAGWQEATQGGHALIRVHYADRVCGACPARAACTQSPTRGRRLTLRPEAEYGALQARRQEQETPAFRTEQQIRAGVEGTHSQAIRRCGLRICRSVGAAKVQLEHLLVGAALNLVRGAAWLSATPRARTRQQAFLTLFAPVAAPC